jgi:hypothetical protein
MSHDDALVNEERARALLLRGFAPGDTEWTDEAAVPDAASLGALDAFRWRARSADVVITVYVFAVWGGGLAAGEAIQDHVDGDQYHCRYVTNGRLLAVAIAPSADPAGRRLADQTLSALAGWE